MIATLTSKGQITVPKSIRDRLNLEPGDRIEFFEREDGAVEFVPVTATVKDLRGILRARRSVSLEDMELAIKSRSR